MTQFPIPFAGGADAATAAAAAAARAVEKMTKDSTPSALLWIVAAGFFMQSLDTTIVKTALPSIAHSLHVAPLAMQPIVVAYTLTMAMLTPASGWLGSPLGPR